MSSGGGRANLRNLEKEYYDHGRRPAGPTDRGLPKGPLGPFVRAEYFRTHLRTARIVGRNSSCPEYRVRCRLQERPLSVPIVLKLAEKTQRSVT